MGRVVTKSPVGVLLEFTWSWGRTCSMYEHSALQL